MQRAQKIFYVVAAVFAMCALAGTAAAQDPQPPEPSRQKQQPPPTPPPSDQPTTGMDKEKDTTMAPNEVMAERMSLTTTVEKVDIKKRMLTLKEDTGNVIKLEVPQDVADIGKIKKGDKLAIDYYASIALQLMKKTTKPGEEETTMAAKEPAKLPGGLVAKKVSVTVEVMKVDTSNNLVTVKGPAGDMDTIHVDDPAMQADLAKLKKGDKIKASYAQAVAITVTPQQKATKQSSREVTPEEQQNNGAPTKEY